MRRIPKRRSWAGLRPDNAARLEELLAIELPEVFKANRIIEQQTGYISEAGRNNLVDALSHIGTLAERGAQLSPRQQAAQVAKIEEHFRRAMMEAPEEVVRACLVDIKQTWVEYQREAGPYRRNGTLRGVPKHSELEQLRKRIDLLMEEARAHKRDETSWEDWRNAAAHMTEAVEVAKELADKLEQCIGEATRMNGDTRRDKKSVRLAVVSIAAGIAIAAVFYLLGQANSPSETASQSISPRGASVTQRP